MGAAGSVEQGNNSNPSSTTTRQVEPQKKEASRKKRGLNGNIFDRQSITNLSSSKEDALQDGDLMDEVTYELVSKSLMSFFVMQQGASGKQSSNAKMDKLIKRMKREAIIKDITLITEGESGSKLYIVESGELEVYINGESIRKLSKGNMLGELALLYDAPRTATVICSTDCVLWSLTREIFKQVQALWGLEVQTERSRGLIASPDLAVLSAIDMSRLVGVLQSHEYPVNSKVFEESTPTQTVCLIERGTAMIYTSLDISKLPPEEVDKRLSIFRPRIGDNTGTGNSGDSVLSPISPSSGVSGVYACQVGPGCLIGIGALRSKAKLQNGWKWVNGPENNFIGAESPFTCIASSLLVCNLFSVEAFENLFGPAFIVLQAAPPAGLGKLASMKSAKKEIKFDGSKFKMKHVLGSGSFGVVILAEYKPSKEATPITLALKCLSKFSVVETGQLRHVLDERKLLASMDSPFILHLYGTYQTPHQLVMVTEALDCGDLWSILYETAPFCDENSLSLGLTQFYCASLVLALDHAHSKGVVYRDLKPENIILDSRGYLRLIDFGFAKKVPYTKIGADGKEHVYSKTFTLCGTPEYLAPELIFNLGHDQTSDLWALGVLLHEMLMCITPFAPKRQDNVTELFTNIAMVKKNGLKLDKRLDRKGDAVKSLIIQLLSPEPELRIGVQGARTKKLLEHPFFKDFSINELASEELEPEFIPTASHKRDPISGLQPVKSYNGDQKIFAEF